MLFMNYYVPASCPFRQHVRNYQLKANVNKLDTRGNVCVLPDIAFDVQALRWIPEL